MGLAGAADSFRVRAVQRFRLKQLYHVGLFKLCVSLGLTGQGFGGSV